MIKNDKTIEANHFEELINKSGLDVLVANFRQRGYIIRPINSSELRYLYTTVCHPVRKELLFHKESLTVHPEINEIECFTAVMLHEFGHLIAAERGQDPHDEVLAWDIGKEISPVILPDCYALLQEIALISYKHRSREEQVSLTEQCPDCNGSNWSIRPIMSLSMDGNEWERLTQCGDCGSEFVIVFPRTLNPIYVHNPIPIPSNLINATYRAKIKDE